MTEPVTAPNAERLKANHQVVERFVATVNAKTYEALDALVHADYVDHDPIPGRDRGSRD